MLPAGIALHCLARTFCINAAVTTRGMQQIGLAFVLSPALRHLYPDTAARARAFARYGGHSNTHVFMMPLYAGIVLSLEEQIAHAALPEEALAGIRGTLGAALSALGDSFFSGSLLPLWVLTCSSLILAGLHWVALLLSLCLLVGLQIFRALTFFTALRHGITVLMWLRRLNLINWAGRIKMCNALLTALLAWQLCSIPAEEPAWQICAAALAGLLATAWLKVRLRLPRLLFWLLLAGALILMDEALPGM